MKRLLLNLLCLLFTYPCFAGEPIQLARMNPWIAGSVGPSCTTGTTDQSNTTTDTAVGMPYYFVGQSFQVSKTGYIHAIKVRGIGDGDGTGTFTLRIGNSANLTTYWKEVQLVANIGWNEPQTLFFDIGDIINQVSPGNTYYFEISESGTSFQAYFSSTNTYANGTGYYSADGNKWDLTGHQEIGDLSFDVDLCD